MNTTLHPSELLSLVTRLNFEIQEQIIECLTGTAGLDCVVGWDKVGEEDRMEIRTDTRMVAVLSVVIPANVIDSTCHSIPLSGARIELVAGWRMFSGRRYIRDSLFGDAGTLVLALPSFEPEHIEAAATTLAGTISEYLGVQLETC